MSYDKDKLKKILEGAILAAGEPLTVQRMQCLFEESEMPEKEDILAALAVVQEDCEGRGFNLIEIASGWRFQVCEDLASWVNHLWDEKPQKYSRALLETLALVAYRQPLTRSDIENVRGVAVSSHIIKTLIEREWVKVVGHRDVPGRPALYATTKQFLDYFNLKSLEELPTLSELKDIDGLNETLDFDESEAPTEQTEHAESETVESAEAEGLNRDIDNQPGPATTEEPISEHVEKETDEQALADDSPVTVIEENPLQSNENDKPQQAATEAEIELHTQEAEEPGQEKENTDNIAAENIAAADNDTENLDLDKTEASGTSSLFDSIDPETEHDNSEEKIHD